jgi:hypothetical protein
MVRLTKSPLPPDVTIKSEQDYRRGEVIDTLISDCHGKCYICEDKSITFNVEHVTPHRNDARLKYDWNNLFIACGHCNSIKHVKYDEIINPTKLDPEEHIALSAVVTDELMDQVEVNALTADIVTMNTAELLNLVYNGESTSIKKHESTNLRNEHLMPVIRRFYQYIRDYLEEPDLGFAEMIIKEIDRSSAFAAFKRKIVRDDPELSVIFAESLK